MCEALRRFGYAGNEVLILQMALDPSKQDTGHWRGVGSATLARLLRQFRQCLNCICVHESLLEQTRVVGVEELLDLEKGIELKIRKVMRVGLQIVLYENGFGLMIGSNEELIVMNESWISKIFKLLTDDSFKFDIKVSR